MLHIKVNAASQPIQIIVLSEYIKSEVQIKLEESDKTSLELPEANFTTTQTICRFLARKAPNLNLLGNNILQQAEVDHWIDFSNSINSKDIQANIAYLDDILEKVTFLVGNDLTLADVFVWSSLRENEIFNNLHVSKNLPHHVSRYYNYLMSLNCFKFGLDKVPVQLRASSINIRKERKEEGKFIDLPGAEMGKVVVRFPPEASGYLHIGHAKAALLNQYYQQLFEGQLIMRFDDTNPEKENADFEKVILDDIALLGLKPDKFTFTSDHFEILLKHCDWMLTNGKAYADDTDPEIMKKEREARIESKNRNNDVQTNIKMWDEMKKGTDCGLKTCIRAKLNMQSDNGCLRDPTMYRCKLESHPRTDYKYKVYPTYDFACPIVDSIEGVTHALRTTEYHDRDDQYYWFLDTLGLRKPYIWEYSRLNLQNTVMSKRKLTWFVNEGIVQGWDDPRFPTVRGVMRRGMTVEGLKEFVIAQGSSRAVTMMDWDKIWAFNKKIIDPIAPRFTALQKDSIVEVIVDDAIKESKLVAKHPKDDSIGMKNTWYDKKVFIEGADAMGLTIGEIVTFINWGNLKIISIDRDVKKNIKSIKAQLNLENKDYKKTQKITWLADVHEAPLINTLCVNFDHIISKAVLGKEEDFKQFINYKSKIETQMLGDPELAKLKKGDIIQLQRRGFYICDVPYEPISRYSGKDQPCVLFNIPDGHTKEMPTSGSKHKSNVEATLNKIDSQKLKTQSQDAIIGDLQSMDIDLISRNIENVGNKIRDMKAAKASKGEIEGEVKELLALKAQYKSIKGEDWKPNLSVVSSKVSSKISAASTLSDTKVPASATSAESSEFELHKNIETMGNKIRDMKSSGSSKSEIDGLVKELLALKAQYKTIKGEEWKPKASDIICKNIEIVGNKIRDMKAAGASKSEITDSVNELLSLKSEYKKINGEDWKPSNVSNTSLSALSDQKNIKEDQKDTHQKEKKQKKENKKADNMQKVNLISNGCNNQNEKVTDTQGYCREVKKVTRLGMEVKKGENFSEWYSQVITKAEMIEYYDVSGCYVLRPWAYEIWEGISKWFDAEIKKIGFHNCYFPMFISQAALETEKDHIEDFAPEVAWVTRSGKTELAEPIAIRPTSETVMYPSYAKWVQSHRDLPIKLNQWCNVVRWEFKNPQPFLRTREFLWQEGHSAYANKDEAEKEVLYILDLYEKVYVDLLAIPVIKGRKTLKEKFAGGDYTTTVEAYISASGRGIQAATSHHLGQNFSKMFDISYEHPDTHERIFAFQNSWGITTRSIGIIIMTHGDDKGLVMPPRIAPIQVVIVPCGITVQMKEEDKQTLMEKCEKFTIQLKEKNIKAHFDSRDNYSPGWKFNHWELKGVPIRVEIGPRDVQNNEFVTVRRDNAEKGTYKMQSSIDSISKLLEDIHTNMLTKSKKDLDSNIATCFKFSDFCTNLDQNKLILAPFCGEISCEENIKKLSTRDTPTEEGAPAMGAKGLCIPFKQPAEIKNSDKCIGPDCSKMPKMFTLFGKSY